LIRGIGGDVVLGRAGVNGCITCLVVAKATSLVVDAEKVFSVRGAGVGDEFDVV